jgi:serine phosphatase RsbU (regulator of sigma subunit)
MPRVPKLVVEEPSGDRREVEVKPLPFHVGRQATNELPLRDSRISRQHARIVESDGKFVLEDMGSKHGTFVNAEKITKRELRTGDVIDFGLPNCYRLTYMGEGESLVNLLERVESSVPTPGSAGGLHHLGVLLEVARALHSSMSLEDVLITVVDAAIRVTKTQRGVLLLRTPAGELDPTVARDVRQNTLPPRQLEISQSVLRHVVNSRQELIVSDLGDYEGISQQASVVRLQLHTVVAIPLEKLPAIGSLDTTLAGKPAELLGVLYLDSHNPSSAFSDLDREVLRTLALEAASVVENARLFALSRARERLEHEMKIAQDIQRQLLPRAFPSHKDFSITGTNVACEMVGGDYFDVIELPGERCGLVVADVSGKGISAALLTSMIQGIFSATAVTDIHLDQIATRVNKYLKERSADDRYATLFYGVLDPNGSLDYINAGHVPAMVRTALGQVYTLGSDNFPLGMFDFAEYHSARAHLQPGDFMVIYTDGISEARNLKDDMFGEHGLREVLKSFPGGSVEDLSRAILAAVRDFTGGAPQADDLTLVVVHYRKDSE